MVSYEKIERLVMYMIRVAQINDSEHEACIDLIWKTFIICNALDYSAEGRQTFYDYIHDNRLWQKAHCIGAYEEDQLVGAIIFKNAHIQLFFVDPTKQGKGIGRALFDCVKTLTKGNFITVSSSLYAIRIYKQLGFEPLGDLRESGGLVTLAMLYTK